MTKESIDELIELTRENNYMLKQIIAYINHINRNANSENEQDFMRNILANMISNGLELNRLK